MAKTHRNALKPGHKLHWYEIKRILGQGGFGITYLAHDINLDEDVAIKEYLPIELSVRTGDNSVHPITDGHNDRFNWGLDRFMQEARTLGRFKHPNIVRVRNVFEDNNTAYMVMEYEEGESLQELLVRRKTLEETELMKLLVPILGGLALVHKQGFIHRDIKPANIFIREDGSPVLLDFGSARQALFEETRTLTSLVSPGYAPFEQYYSKSDEQGPWTDIYGLAATLYRAVTGRVPLDAVDRSKAILNTSQDTFVLLEEIVKGQYSERFLKAVDFGLRFKQADRPKSVTQWLEEFGVPTEPAAINPSLAANPTEAATEVALGEAPPDEPKTNGEVGDTQPSKAGRARHWLALAAVAGIAITGGSVYMRPGIEVPDRDLVSEGWSPDEGWGNLDKVAQTAAERNAEEVFNSFLSGLPKHTSTKAGLARDERGQEDKVAQTAAEIEARKQRLVAEQDRAAAIQKLVSAAEADIVALRLTNPAGNNALEKLEEIKALEPGHKSVQRLQSAIVNRYLGLAEQGVRGGKFDLADSHLNRAEGVQAGNELIEEVRQRIKRQRENARLAEEAAVQRSAGQDARKEVEAVVHQETTSETLAVEMVDIPSGSFQMGSKYRARKVRVSAFRLGKTEVTQGQWQQIMGSNPSRFKYCGENCPVERVSWDEVQEFLLILNQQTEENYRLPTEAEWEYACRSAGSHVEFCGDSPDTIGWYPTTLGWIGANSEFKTHPVSQKAANGLGLYDMTGNVWEWVMDCWNDNFSGAPDDGTAWISGECGMRVKRGGSYFDSKARNRSGSRDRDYKTTKSFINGFRLAQDK